MKHPGYLLNPGDMFQVDPERVMFATGAPKDSSDVSSSDKNAKTPEEGEDGAATSEERVKEAEKEEGDERERDEENPRKVLKSLLLQAKSILKNSKGGKLSAHRKQELRGFQKQIKRQLSRSGSHTIMSDSLEAQFEELKRRLLPQTNTAAREQSAPASSEPTAPPNPSAQDPPQRPASSPEDDPSETFTDEDLSLLQSALTRIHVNPYDPTKPYATPWTPRPYMSAFAFIPRYLEVNQNICAAVYLRHPVARPGMAEVPTPFGEVTGSNAFTWYLRKR